MDETARGSGRTTRMINQAVGASRAGKRVGILAHSRNESRLYAKKARDQGGGPVVSVEPDSLGVIDTALLDLIFVDHAVMEMGLGPRR